MGRPIPLIVTIRTASAGTPSSSRGDRNTGPAGAYDYCASRSSQGWRQAPGSSRGTLARTPAATSAASSSVGSRLRQRGDTVLSENLRIVSISSRQSCWHAGRHRCMSADEVRRVSVAWGRHGWPIVHGEPSEARKRSSIRRNATKSTRRVLVNSSTTWLAEIRPPENVEDSVPSAADRGSSQARVQEQQLAPRGRADLRRLAAQPFDDHSVIGLRP